MSRWGGDVGTSRAARVNGLPDPGETVKSGRSRSGRGPPPQRCARKRPVGCHQAFAEVGGIPRGTVAGGWILQDMDVLGGHVALGQEEARLAGRWRGGRGRRPEWHDQESRL